jgi:hypothetical protein
MDQHLTDRNSRVGGDRSRKVGIYQIMNRPGIFTAKNGRASHGGHLPLPALMHVRFLPQDHLQLWTTEEDLDCMAREKMEKRDYGMRLRSKMDVCTKKI